MSPHLFAFICEISEQWFNSWSGHELVACGTPCAVTLTLVPSMSSLCSAHCLKNVHASVKYFQNQIKSSIDMEWTRSKSMLTLYPHP